MLEPLRYFYDKEGFQKDHINNITFGEKYVAVELNNGQIGICATLLHPVEAEFDVPDLTKIPHRIILNAYFNALFNYQIAYDDTSDIFDKIEFIKGGRVVMIGYFKSLVRKFEAENIPLSIFDLHDTTGKMTPFEKQNKYIANADTLILTSTSVFNQSFLSIVNNTSVNCRVYLLGPSTILHPDMLRYRNIKILFGSIFERNKDKLLEVIKRGEGTPSFSKYMRKVYLSNS
ncbi:MAG: hypothetical protein ISR55_03000 [Bacteroidetes bacterium]|nr:hypothetical protein [Bacteroidota bacterium]MBL6962763.1 hypothetical protein [Bacteroidota bacterium]